MRIIPRIAPAIAAIIALGGMGKLRADEFTDLAGSFGTATTVAGIAQATTNNPDGTAINFWVPASEGAQASVTSLSNPHMAGADAFGNLYIADKASHSILKITPEGLIHTFAGTHVAGFNGDGPAAATALQINNPNGLFVLPDGTVYLLDPGNARIRRVGTDGVMTTIVADPEPNWHPSGRALWVSADQQLIYYTHEYAPIPPSLLADGSVVKKWTPAGGIEIVCSKAVGFVNPGNIAVGPLDGKLYVTDRGEDDPNKLAPGLWRIDGPNLRTRITGNITQPVAASGQLAINSFIDQTRGIAFLPNGAYFICGHKDGSIWYVDTAGVLHLYIQGRGKNDGYILGNGLHPPLTGVNYLAQPRALTIAPNGDLIGVCNDSGYVFVVGNVSPPDLPADFRATHRDAGGLRLGWTGTWGRGYIVERTPALGMPSWQPIGAVAGTGALTEFLDADAASMARAFYRLTPPQ
jgi:DNA-binding beta-propeller fold protein YncE